MTELFCSFQDLYFPIEQDIQLQLMVPVVHVPTSYFEIFRYVETFWIDTFYSNVLNRLMVRVEIQPLSMEEQTLKWEEIIKIKLSNLFGLSIQEVGPVSILPKVLWLATVSSCRTTTLVHVERTYSSNGPTGSASAAKTPLLGTTWYKDPPIVELFFLDHLGLRYTTTLYGSWTYGLSTQLEKFDIDSISEYITRRYQYGWLRTVAG